MDLQRSGWVSREEAVTQQGLGVSPEGRPGPPDTGPAGARIAAHGNWNAQVP